MKYLTIAEMKEKGVTPIGYQSRELEKAEALAKQVSVFIPAEVAVSCSEYDGAIHFEHPLVHIKHNGLTYQINYNDYSKKYFIFCVDIREIKNVTNYTVANVEKDLDKPNNIGVLNLKKIMEWISYYKKVYEKVTEKSSGNKNRIDEFLESIKGLDVKWFHNKTQGEIIKNGIKFSFKISDEYVTEQIEIYYEVDATLSSFLKLSDNKYKSKKED